MTSYKYDGRRKKMIVSKCPLRISLMGGSTDLEDFIQKNGRGAVINFSTTLYTYITFHNDLLGYNMVSKKYIINYSQREECNEIRDIKNDVAREVLNYLDVPHATVSFTSDIFSSGSGLASSSSYVLSLIKAASHHRGLSLTNFEICKKGLSIERKFNPLTGYQDPYGCGLGGLRRLDFKKGKDPEVRHLPENIFKKMDMFLIYTGVSRGSTNVLRKVCQQPRIKFLDYVDEMELAIRDANVGSFVALIDKGWNYKKIGNPHILGDERLKATDDLIGKDRRILAHRLCGAGSGGYFLVFMHSNPGNSKYLMKTYKHVLPVGISSTGVCSEKI